MDPALTAKLQGRNRAVGHELKTRRPSVQFL
jgi:hypothetical protein